MHGVTKRTWTKETRITELQRLQVLDTAPEEVFDNVTAIASEICNCPIALVSLVDEHRQWFKSRHGIEVQETPLNVSFCARAIEQDEDLFVVPDAALDERFSKNPLVVGSPFIRYYAGALLRTQNGVPIGTVCVVGDKPRPHGLSVSERRILLSLARATVRELELRAAFRALDEAHNRIEALIEASSAVVWRADLTGAILDSVGWEALTGQGPGQYLGHGWREAVHPEDLPLIKAAWRPGQDETPVSITYRVRAGSGDYRWVLARGVPVRGQDGKIVEWVGTVLDVHESRLASSAIQASEQRLRLALRASRTVAIEKNGNGEVLRSENALEVLDLPARGPDGEFSRRVNPKDLPNLREMVRASIEDGAAGTVDVRFRRSDNSEIWVSVTTEQTPDGRLVGTISDITERKRAEKALAIAATRDPLTGVFNRTGLQERMTRELSRALKPEERLALYFIDLDTFKEVNDAFGHAAGDAVLKQTAQRLEEFGGEGSIVARTGGDEFALLLRGVRSLDEVRTGGLRLAARLREPFPWGDRMLDTRASIGISCAPDHNQEPGELVKCADLALYVSKREGRGRATMFSESERAAARHRHLVLTSFTDALDEAAITPYYQPKVCLVTRRVKAWEALARWIHPVEGVVGPSFFEPALTDPHLSSRLTRFLLKRVGEDIRRWSKAGFISGRVAINLSAAEFSIPDAGDRFLRFLDEACIPPDSIEVEVTESVFLERETACRSLRKLHECGISIALDDFGTGYGSLIHLKRFPINHVKIDRSFIGKLTSDRKDQAIVGAISSIAESFGMEVTAEGIETEEQARLARLYGCTLGQGFLFAKAMPASEVLSYIHRFGSAEY